MVKRRSTLKGRGSGPSKVAPAPPAKATENPDSSSEAEEKVNSGEITIEDITEADLDELRDAGQETLKSLYAKYPFLGSVDDDELLNILVGVSSVKVAKKNGTVIAMKIEGEPDDTAAEEDPYPVVYGDKTAFEEEGGRRRRSRLQKQTRRTQRHRRNRKGKQLRKLATRRR